MSMYSIWGFGTFAIEGTNMGMMVIFEDSYCVLSFERVSITKENLNNVEMEHFKGHRAYLDVEIKSMGDSSYQKLIKLAQILDNGTYKIYPFYNQSIPLSKQLVLDHQYRMRETSEFSIRHSSKYFQVGQNVELSFKAKKLVQERPKIHNDEDLITIVGSRFTTYNRTIKI